MDSEHENRNGEDGRHAELGVSEAERGSGEDQRAALQSDDTDRSIATTLREAPVSAKRRRAERRQTSALIAWWGNVERRSGEDRRASPSDNGIDDD